MTLLINDTAPNFFAYSSEGDFFFHDWIGEGYAILFSHPRDFTPVCTTEFISLSSHFDEFRKRNCRVAGLSVDSVEEHFKWCADIEKISGQPLGFPIIEDLNLSISRKYGMLPAEALAPYHYSGYVPHTVRSTFFIGPGKKVRAILTYPEEVGRNMTELLRVLDALILTDGGPYGTPADWRVGEKVVLSVDIETEAAKEIYREVEVVNPYFRKISL